MAIYKNVVRSILCNKNDIATFLLEKNKFDGLFLRIKLFFLYMTGTFCFRDYSVSTVITGNILNY